MTDSRTDRDMRVRDDAEPRRDGAQGEDANSSPPRECHRRGCTEPAAFVVVERYLEETGHGAVEAKAFLCQEHTAEESPVNLDSTYEDYLFRVDPLLGANDTSTAGSDNAN
ncbi:hypothetical protein ACNS7O_15760 (plasmid) [Haloferacaceae archaeon DSL9]